MLVIVLRVTRTFAAVEGTLAVIGGHVEDQVPRWRELEEFAGDTFKVVPEGVPIRQEQGQGEDVRSRDSDRRGSGCSCAGSVAPGV